VAREGDHRHVNRKWKESLTWAWRLRSVLPQDGSGARKQRGAAAIAGDTITCSLVRRCGIGNFRMYVNTILAPMRYQLIGGRGYRFTLEGWQVRREEAGESNSERTVLELGVSG
jgi:hypothetical protein